MATIDDIKVDVGCMIHEAVAKTMQRIATEHKIKVTDVRLDWIETMEGKLILHNVTMMTERRP